LEILNNSRFKWVSNWIIFIVSAVYIFCPKASAQTITGNILGKFQGEIEYNIPVSIKNGIVTGDWSFDSD